MNTNKTLRHPSIRDPRWSYGFSSGIAAFYKGRSVDDIDQAFDRNDVTRNEWIRGWIFAKAESLREKSNHK